MTRIGDRLMRVLTVGLVAWSLAGCVDANRRRLPPKPRVIEIDRVVMRALVPADSDADGAPDTVRASINLFDSDYPLAIAGDGTMVFELSRPGEPPVYRWTFAPGEAAAGRRRSPVGVMYLFDLRLDQEVARWISDSSGVNSFDLRYSYSPLPGAAGETVGSVVSDIRWDTPS